VEEKAQGCGIARALLEGLITASEDAGYLTLQSQIMAANKASLELHRKAGFREVGYRKRYGHINGDWHDVILFERRSVHTGGLDLPTRTCD